MSLRLYTDLIEAIFDNPNYAVAAMREDVWTRLGKYCIIITRISVKPLTVK